MECCVCACACVLVHVCVHVCICVGVHVVTSTLEYLKQRQCAQRLRVAQSLSIRKSSPSSPRTCHCLVKLLKPRISNRGRRRGGLPAHDDLHVNSEEQQRALT